MREKVLVLLCVLLLSLVAFASVLSSASGSVLLNLFDEEQEEAVLPVSLLMKQGGELNPKEPAEGELDIPAGIPNGYVADGPWGILGHTEYRNIGTWSSPGVKYETHIEPGMVYSLWCYWEGGSQSVDLRVCLYVNDVMINATQQELLEADFEEAPKEFLIEFTGANITLNKGDELSMKVEGRVNGNGGKVLYGGPNHKSGVFFDCDSLRIRNIQYDNEMNEIRVQITDAFGLSPYLLNPQLFLDNTLVPLEFYTGMNSDTFFTEIVFSLEQWEAYFEGEHTAEVSVSYGDSAQPVKRSMTFDYREDEQPLIDIPWNMLGVLLGLVFALTAILAIVALIRKRKS